MKKSLVHLYRLTRLYRNYPEVALFMFFSQMDVDVESDLYGVCLLGKVVNSIYCT